MRRWQWYVAIVIMYGFGIGVVLVQMFGGSLDPAVVYGVTLIAGICCYGVLNYVQQPPKPKWPTSSTSYSGQPLKSVSAPLPDTDERSKITPEDEARAEAAVRRVQEQRRQKFNPNNP